MRVNLRIILIFEELLNCSTIEGDEMTTYNTEQKNELLRFLKKNSQKSFTIEEICNEMHADNQIETPPGKSTLYRLIPKLVEDNMIKQFNGGKGRKNVYQVIGDERCNSHLHLKCVNCGRIIHMDSDISVELSKMIQMHDEFKVSTGKTTIFGTCKECI